MADTTQRVFDAPTVNEGPIPAYKIVEMEGPFTHEVTRFDEKTRTLSRDTVTTDVGYMVFFPRGHSHMYHSLEALERAGFGEMVPIINMKMESEVNKDHQPKAAHIPIEKVAK
jgi:hypothetical protein